MKITNNWGESLNYMVYSSGTPTINKTGTIDNGTSIDIPLSDDYCYGAFFSNTNFKPEFGTALGANNNLAHDATIRLALTGNDCNKNK